MIEVKNLYKTYLNNVVAIDNMSFEVKKGDIFGIIGTSGAGKSSLIRCINRLEEPTKGNIIIDSVDITNISYKELMNIRRKMGMIFQSFNLFSRKTVFENIAFPLRIEKLNNKEIKKRVLNILKLVGMTDKEQSYPSELSGGQKQRVAIARALVNNPKILLCDEATSALDPSTSEQILELLKSLRDKLDLTILIITHDFSVIKKICNKVLTIEKGKKVQFGNTIDLFSKPSMYIKNDLQKLPKGVAKAKVLSLVFSENSAKEALISKVIKKFDCDINILLGKIEYIENLPVGQLLVEIDEEEQKINQIVEYLNDSHVNVEVIDCE